jgi:hypothetical protein
MHSVYRRNQFYDGVVVKPEIKREWVSRLRDGSYEQGTFQLRDLEDRYDPVGVLMDLASQHGVIAEPKKKSPDTGSELFFGYTYDGQAVRMSKTVEEWSGLNFWLANRIIGMNDKGQTFAEIADYIEENF